MASRYIVFRRDDWEAKRQGAYDELDDAVVLRQRDRFSSPALQAYLDAVSNAIEILEEIGSHIPPDLYEIRDWALGVVNEARQAERHLPDM